MSLADLRPDPASCTSPSALRALWPGLLLRHVGDTLGGRGKQSLEIVDFAKATEHQLDCRAGCTVIHSHLHPATGVSRGHRREPLTHVLDEDLPPTAQQQGLGVPGGKLDLPTLALTSLRSSCIADAMSVATVPSSSGTQGRGSSRPAAVAKAGPAPVTRRSIEDILYCAASVSSAFSLAVSRSAACSSRDTHLVICVSCSVSRARDPGKSLPDAGIAGWFFCCSRHGGRVNKVCNVRSQPPCSRHECQATPAQAAVAGLRRCNCLVHANSLVASLTQLIMHNCQDQLFTGECHVHMATAVRQI